MSRAAVRFPALFANAFFLGALTACQGEAPRREAPRSAAADVPAHDIRRLPPGRAARARDMMLVASDRGRVLGADSAPLHVYVVSDFQCTECRIWFDSILPVIRRTYIDPGSVRLVWVNYPLREHPAAVRAASAALCASVAGHFWEAARRLFASQSLWGAPPVNDALIDSVATAPGVDPYTLRLCTSSNRMLRQVHGDINFSDSLGAGAPPTVVIGRRVLPRGTSVTALRAILDSALAAR